MTNPQERRSLERFNLVISAKIEAMDIDLEEGLHDLMTTDICSGGAFFQTTKPLPVGTEVKIGLVLPLDKFKAFIRDQDEVYVNITGRVLRSGSTGMAIGFNEDYRFSRSGAGRAPRH